MDKSNDSPVTVTVDSNCGERNCNAVGAKKWFRRSGEGSDRQKTVSCEGVSRQFRGERDRKLRMISSGRPSSGGEEHHRAQQTATRPARSSLNPSANEWSPCSERAPEEDRCLFLTFSNGYPLAESQIFRFFTNKFGPCVEKVYVHRLPRNMETPPLFGKVIFSVSYIPAVILSGGNQTKFMVDGRTLWCKKFEGKKKQTHWSTNSVQLYQC